VTLLKGVYPVAFDHVTRESSKVMQLAEARLKELGAVEDGDLIILTIGEPIGKPGGTNTMKVIRIGSQG
jgi:pyruvate kinase